MTPAFDYRKAAREILGYLNFSNGAPDPAFLRNLDELFAQLDSRLAWKALGALLQGELREVHGTTDAFKQVDQATAVVGLVFDYALPTYHRHHADLLFHQSDEDLFQPFFIGRMCEAVLQQGGPWDQTQRIVDGAVEQINDFIGHRPVAVLETEQKIQPYAHEWVRPIPLFIRGAGVARGRYKALIEGTLDIIEATDPALLFDAHFDPQMLDELALDPKAYDFDHPINKRPNYVFGQWDLCALDNSGRSRRFVVHQVALDAMLARVEHCEGLPFEEVLFEASAVLAGTMLMGSGVSGNSPDAHGSDVTLATLVQHIAAYRDAFYDQLIERMKGQHVKRLRAEAKKLRQPLGGARQDFNQHLANRRAEQLQHVHLAQLFAQMGYTEAAIRQVRVVPVASARTLCDVHCRLTVAHREIENSRLKSAAAMAAEIEGLLHRGIECGALVDPWNILGFDGNYSLFPAPENSVHDHRIDELISAVSEIFGLYVQIEKEAAAAGDAELQNDFSGRLGKMADWWDRFASGEVGSVEGISGRETRQSGDLVAAALRAWHDAGTAAGDIAFWRGHVKQFSSPKAYALVVEALLQQRDPIAAMALLIQWLSQAEHIPLIEESYAFHDLALNWMEDLWQTDGEAAEDAMPRQQRWALSRKFLDFLEANAEDYWRAPRFELGNARPGAAEHSDQPKADEQEDLFSAAYEEVTYRDSTADGFEGETRDGGGDATTDFELVLEADRIITRLSFLTMLAQLWRLAAAASKEEDAPGGDRDDVLAGWLAQAMVNRRQLQELLAAVDGYRIPAPRGTHEALVEYDRRRSVKEMLLEQIIAASVETADAARMVFAAMRRDEPVEGLDDWEGPAAEVLRAVLRGDAAAVRDHWQELIDSLSPHPLLYVALPRSGNPQRIVASRSIQCVLRRLLTCLPRLGLLSETNVLIETIHNMELDHPVGQGAITEFDQMFRIGCKAICRCLVLSAEQWHAKAGSDATRMADLDLISYLEQTTEVLLRCWLAHSRGVRLSVLESINDKSQWQQLKRFIERYGGDLFTQYYMNLGNLRAILHEGVDAWLESLEEEPGAEEELQLLRDLGKRLPRGRATDQLSLILEAVAENYEEYIDYNSTTTQSDRGEMLYTLLDFLRLRVHYDRVAWNLQPVVLAHEVLVRCNRDEAAEIWRQAVARRTADIADEHLKRLTRLTRKYGMRLPSIADRLGERFVRPLAIDRLRALAAPAIEELYEEQDNEIFSRLEEEIAPFTAELTGAGFDVPSWLEALEREVDRIQGRGTDEDDEWLDPHFEVPQVRLSLREVERQVKKMTGKKRSG